MREIPSEVYGISQEDIGRTKKICELLKDADALDRYRFAKYSRLDPSYLRSETAKSQEVMEYAKAINEQVAGEILRKSYGMSEDEISTERVAQLRQIRISGGIFRRKEKPLSTEDLLKIYGLEEPELENSQNENTLPQNITEKPNDILKKAYKNFQIVIDDVNKRIQAIMQKMVKRDKIDKSQQNNDGQNR